jgi:hypothetical protein
MSRDHALPIPSNPAPFRVTQHTCRLWLPLATYALSVAEHRQIKYQLHVRGIWYHEPAGHAACLSKQKKRCAGVQGVFLSGARGSHLAAALSSTSALQVCISDNGGRVGWGHVKGV